jgi:type II restriction/modification system DNA methylase subunit YeeA
MTPQEFIKKWKPVAPIERATAHTHFNDLCELFGHPTPIEDDPTGEHFAFEKGASKTGGGEGWADVWKKGYFAWEYKKKKRDLDKAMEQLSRYAAGLENPPIHVACDTHIFRIETRWTNEAPAKYEFELEELAEPTNFERLHAVFFNPEALRSGRTRSKLTKEAADKFQTISDSLQHRNPDREAVAHFVNQLVFCFFADGVGLLPNGVWKKLLQTAERRPERAKQWLDQLFADMKDGGDFNLGRIDWFNGGLFDGRPALALTQTEIGLLFAAASLDWTLIDPTIFGTLFERFLDPDKRAQIGAHYTDPDKIEMIIEPVVLRPLRAEWEAALARIEAIMAPALEGPGIGGKGVSAAIKKRFEAARAKAEIERDAFIDRLCALRILDPACGSGNFLYLALQGVKDIEWRAILDCEAFGLGMAVPRVDPKILHGVEINPFAAELARTTVWIGDIQWRVKNAIQHHPSPLLSKLDSIKCRDALLAPNGEGGFKEADEWPDADFIVGNPPFLGSKLLRNGRPAKYRLVRGERTLVRVALPGLGDLYVNNLFRVYKERVAATSDLVCYWFYKTWEAMKSNRVRSAGLVATNKIRGGSNRRVIDPIAAKDSLFDSWSDEPWFVDGAAVRVSLVCFGSSPQKNLNGLSTAHINADLTGGKSDFTKARQLKENHSMAARGVERGGQFETSGLIARDLLTAPINVNGRPNSKVIERFLTVSDLTDRDSDEWIVDFYGMNRSEAAAFEAPFELVEHVLSEERRSNNEERTKQKWWLFRRSGKEFRKYTGENIICTPLVSKHRYFIYMARTGLPDTRVVSIFSGSLTLFGILSLEFHTQWSLSNCQYHGVGNDPVYTHNTTLETFPFPDGLTPNIPVADYADDPRAQAIAAAAKRLDELRRAWLNPADLVDIVPEITPTAAPGEAPRRYPDRIVPKTAEAAVKLKDRTLTNLYNQRPRWLADAHDALDRAVAASYSWPEDISTEDALARLLALNLERASMRR